MNVCVLVNGKEKYELKVVGWWFKRKWCFLEWCEKVGWVGGREGGGVFFGGVVVFVDRVKGEEGGLN